MPEQELIDYIKKARAANQSDGQTRSLLYKNGWTESEVNDAFNAIIQPQTKSPAQAQAQPQIQSQVSRAQAQPQQQPRAEEQPESRPEPQIRPQIQQPKPEPKAQPQPQYQPAQANMPRSRGKSHFLLKFILVLIMLIVIGGAGLYYVLSSQIYNPSWNPFGSNPNEVIAKMLANMETVNSYNAKASGEIDVLNSNGENQGNLLFSFDSENDITDKDNPKANIALIGDVTSPESESPASVDANIIIFGKTLYIKINQPSTLDIYNLNYSDVLGKWLKFDENSANALTETEGATVSFSEESTKILVPASYIKYFSFEKQLGGQTVNNHDTYHYLLKLDASSSMEIWIGKDDYMLYGYKVDKTVDKISLQLSATLSNFNEAVSIGEPDDATKIENVILPMIKVQKTKTDIIQIGLLAESIFNAGSSYSTLCNKSLLNGYQESYGSELINLNNDIISQGAKKPACYSSLDNYCASTQLADGSFLCVGKNANLGKIQCVSIATACE